MCGAAISSLRLQSRATVAQASACAIPASCRGTIHRARLRLSSNRTSSMQRRAPFSRKHMDLRQEEFARLLRVNKTTLSKWENNEDPIGLQSDLLARAIVISRDKRLEKRAADHIRAFEKIADQQKRVRVEVDAEKLEYEYA